MWEFLSSYILTNTVKFFKKYTYLGPIFIDPVRVALECGLKQATGDTETQMNGDYEWIHIIEIISSYVCIHNLIHWYVSWYGESALALCW